MDEDDNDFENEYNVFERTEYLEHDYLAETDDETPVTDTELVQRFYIFIDAVMRNLNELKIIKVTQADIKEVLRRSRLLTAPKFKNPTAYVLGYWVSQNGTFDRKRFDNVVKLIDELIYPVKPYDIIRYTNLWLNRLM